MTGLNGTHSFLLKRHFWWEKELNFGSLHTYQVMGFHFLIVKCLMGFNSVKKWPYLAFVGLGGGPFFSQLNIFHNSASLKTSERSTL